MSVQNPRRDNLPSENDAPAAKLAAPVLVAESVAVTSLEESDARRLYALMLSTYDAVAYDRFVTDLSNKNYVILLRSNDGEIRGFSTLADFDFDFEGSRRRIVFSGDTVVESAYRGEQALALEWIRLVSRLGAERPDVPLYWFLIVKGEKTYRFLPTFFHEYYPSRSRATPPDVKRFMDSLAQARFGAAYDADRGVIVFPRSLGQLKINEIDLTSTKVLKHPEIQHFYRLNPGFADGDELVCLTPIFADNFKSFARKVFASSHR